MHVLHWLKTFWANAFSLPNFIIFTQTIMHLVLHPLPPKKIKICSKDNGFASFLLIIFFIFEGGTRSMVYVEMVNCKLLYLRTTFCCVRNLKIEQGMPARLGPAYIHTYTFYLFGVLYNKQYINYFQISKNYKQQKVPNHMWLISY